MLLALPSLRDNKKAREYGFTVCVVHRRPDKFIEIEITKSNSLIIGNLRFVYAAVYAVVYAAVYAAAYTVHAAVRTHRSYCLRHCLHH